MRKVISANLETVARRSPRFEASTDTKDSIKVKAVHPESRIQAIGAKKMVVRPRYATDPPGLVKTVAISGEHYLADDAWKDASGLLQNLE